MKIKMFATILSIGLLASCAPTSTSSSSISVPSSGTSGFISTSFTTVEGTYADKIRETELLTYDNSKCEPYKEDGEIVKLKTYYINDVDYIPYVNVSDFVSYISKGIGLYIEDTSIVNEGNVIKIYGNYDSYLSFDFNKNEITINSYYAALGSRKKVPGNMLSLGSNTNSFKYLKYNDGQFNLGTIEKYNLSDYNMQMYLDKNNANMAYVPAMVISKLYTSASNFDFLYDETGVYCSYPKLVDDDKNLTEYGKLFYNKEYSNYSEEFVKYQYDLLCFDMDLSYGLASTHDMNNGFDSFCKRRALDEDLLKTDPKEFEEGLAMTMLQYIDDVHVKYASSGRNCGNYTPTAELGYARKYIFDKYDKYAEDRKNKITDFMPYMEYGDIAYVTIDSFTSPKTNYYNETPELENSMDCTFNIVAYANKQIKRENSPIKTVVLDLTKNEGGALDAGAFTIGWLLGDATLYSKNLKSNETCAVNYSSDVDFDQKITDDDNVSNLNIVCLASTASFSCGNLVPCCLKASNKVIMMGQRTGGGCCSVNYRYTAGGSIYRISSRNMLCTYRNGEFISVEDGATPDIYINEDNFYNREYINSVIRNVIPQ